eukprot:TRINITY_DN64265_c0_g1_i1.p2 TRINITY_DN64265_c0_g1~~TRINITY_DN64265_c0_g1_i1.p2  ORF type:complete len:101 (+),score=18.08 TRINITY_DN64265_c0_g1_i1:24-305(+)
MSNLHESWVVAAGGCFGSVGTTSGDVADSALPSLCEVSPLVSYGGEDLAGQFRGFLSLPLLLGAAGETACVEASPNAGFAEICSEGEELPPTP